MAEFWSWLKQKAAVLWASGNGVGAGGIVSAHRRQAAPGAGGISARWGLADSLQAGKLRVSLLRDSVHFAHAPGRARGAGDVCLLRSDRLLPGDRRPGVLENAEHAVEGSGFG